MMNDSTVDILGVMRQVMVWSSTRLVARGRVYERRWKWVERGWLAVHHTVACCKAAMTLSPAKQNKTLTRWPNVGNPRKVTSIVLIAA